MNSRQAHSLLKELGQVNKASIKGRTGYEKKQSHLGTQIAYFADRPLPGNDMEGQLTDKTGGSRTDYRGKPDLARVPMKDRARYQTTQWPVGNRPTEVIMQPESRNIGHTVWRKYPNGQIDYRDVMSHVVEAKRRFREAPINEVDALMLSSVYPEFDLGIDRKIVELKAPLSQQDRTLIRAMVEKAERELALRQIVDLGGA
jgi:hypothetical protein